MKLAVASLALFLAAGAFARDTSDVPAVEAALRDALFTRTSADGVVYGRDEPDVLIWDWSLHLRSEPSLSKALAALDEFNARHLAKKIKDPVRRVILQRDLWRLFDWTLRDAQPAGADPRAPEALRPRLAAAMQQLALDEKEISRLPHNLNSMGAFAGIADFPRGLLDDSGAWIMLGADGDEGAAPQHMKSFDGHSAFLVVLRLPGGRAATLDYLQALRDGIPAVTTDAIRDHPELGFPADTVWALVRVLNVIDVAGSIRTTQVVESVQLRRYKVVLPPSEPPSLANVTRQVQDTNELQLDRANLPALRAVRPNERQFHEPQFMGHGVDAFIPQGTLLTSAEIDKVKEPVLRACLQCHGPPGLQSIRSFAGFFNALAKPANRPSRFEREAAFSVKWKEQQKDWQALRELWVRSPP